MKRCRQVALVLGFMVLGSGVAFGQANLGLYVVDSNNERVGYPLSTLGMTIFINGSPNAVNSGRNGFAAESFNVYFSAADCTGTGYLRQGNSGGVRPTFTSAYFTADGFLHYSLAESVQEFVHQSSIFIHENGISIDPCDVNSGSFLAAPVLTAAAPLFTPPFRVVESLPVSPAPKTASFNDVPTNHPFFQFIEALYAAGITSGCSTAPKLYCPDSPVTRGQVAVFLAKALGL